MPSSEWRSCLDPALYQSRRPDGGQYGSASRTGHRRRVKQIKDVILSSFHPIARRPDLSELLGFYLFMPSEKRSSARSALLEAHEGLCCVVIECWYNYGEYGEETCGKRCLCCKQQALREILLELEKEGSGFERVIIRLLGMDFLEAVSRRLSDVRRWIRPRPLARSGL